VCYEKSGKIEMALPIVKEGLINAHENAETQLVMARMLIKMGNSNKALEHYAQVMRFALPGTSTYKEAQDALQHSLGLSTILTGVNATGMFVDGDDLYYSHQGDRTSLMGRFNLASHENQSHWMQEIDQWRAIGRRLYFYNQSSGDFCYRELGDMQEKVIFKASDFLADSSIFSGEYGTPAHFECTDNIIIYEAKSPTANNFILRARTLSDGKLLWEKSFDFPILASLCENRLYVAIKNQLLASEVIQCDIKTGTSLWQQTFFHRDDNQINKSLKVFALYVWRQDKNHLLTFGYEDRSDELWKKPNVPFYVIQPNIGLVVRQFFGQELHKQLNIYKNKAVLPQGTWCFSHCYSQNIILGLPIPEQQSYHLSPSDFHEKHPKVLAQFAPLKGLSEDFDLFHHAAVLNNIIDEPSLRRNFINTFKKDYLKRGLKTNPTNMFTPMGYEPLQNTLKIMLEKPSISSDEEKFAARQLMSLWREREPSVEIRAYRYPSGCRFFDACPGEGNFQQFAFGHYRGVMMAADLSNDCAYLNSWNRMPQFYPYHVYYSDVNDIIQHGAHLIVRTKNGIFIYDTAQLLEYMQNYVQTEQGCFSVNSPSTGLANMRDGKSNTTAQINGEHRVIFGCDFGIEQILTSVHLEFQSGDLDAMGGAYVQGSNFSETDGFYNIGTLPQNIQPHQKIILPVSSNQPMRYLRIVSLQKAQINVAEFSAEFK
jgi:hypothetical protein